MRSGSCPDYFLTIFVFLKFRSAASLRFCEVYSIILPVMSSKNTTGIKKQINGRYTVRFQAPTAEVTENGIRRYKNKTMTFDTKGAAEAWLKTQRQAQCNVGRQGTISLVQLAEYSQAKKIAGDVDLREIVREWRKRKPENKSV